MLYSIITDLYVMPSKDKMQGRNNYVHRKIRWNRKCITRGVLSHLKF